MSYAGISTKKKIVVKCKPITQNVLFSIFYTIFIQSMNIKNNDSFLLERRVFVMVCSDFYFFEMPCTDHLGKKRNALSISKILNSINNCLWPVEILVPLDEFHLKEYCQ